MTRFRIAPSRLALAATWLAAVVVSTGIGLLAVNTVGDAASDRGPLGPDTLVVQAPTGASPPPSLPAGGRAVTEEFRYEFGTFTVVCVGPFAREVDTVAAPGWRVVAVEQGPDEDVEAEFSGPTQDVELEVFCNRGAPTVSSLERKIKRPGPNGE